MVMNQSEKIEFCRIRKIVGGLCLAEAPDGVLYSCKVRGIFRKQDISPCAGDLVFIEKEPDWVVTEIKERKNFLLRPPASNLDQMVFVISTCEPAPNYLVLDKLIAIAEYKKIEPLLVVTKLDLDIGDEIESVYKKAGISVLRMDYNDSEGLEELKERLAGKISILVGNSGVGKSTLLNHLMPDLKRETNEISKKLGRGKHTTREVELFPFENGYLADTPGFSSMDTGRYEIIRKEELSGCFREFEAFDGMCRFSDCSHTKEKGCAVLAALEAGIISQSRHESYLQMYEEAKQLKEWELK